MRKLVRFEGIPLSRATSVTSLKAVDLPVTWSAMVGSFLWRRWIWNTLGLSQTDHFVSELHPVPQVVSQNKLALCTVHWRMLSAGCGFLLLVVLFSSVWLVFCFVLVVVSGNNSTCLTGSEGRPESWVHKPISRCHTAEWILCCWKYSKCSAQDSVPE